MDDGGPVEDFMPPVDGGIEDVHMVDVGTPVMSLFSQENTVVSTLPSRNWSFVVGVFRPSVTFFEADV